MAKQQMQDNSSVKKVPSLSIAGKEAPPPGQLHHEKVKSMESFPPSNLGRIWKRQES